MGECLLVRRGGKAMLKSIIVNTPPRKLEYLAGDAFDPTGLVLTADVGGVPINVTTGYTITPETLTADTTHVTISYTADGRTASTTQAVTVKAYDPVFANNTWEKIIEACEAGISSQLWAVGDVSPVLALYNYEYQFRIIGFDHDDLADTDAKYSDASYNNGKNKAAMTLDIVKAAKLQNGYKYQSNGSLSGAWWARSQVRNTTLPAIKSALPETVRNAIRTVVKKTYWDDDYDTLSATKDELFFPSTDEISNRGKGEGTEYAYYLAGNSKVKTIIDGTNIANYQLRSPYQNGSATYSVAFVTAQNTIYGSDYNSLKTYLSFAFCL